jgi:hypothetical protein
MGVQVDLQVNATDPQQYPSGNFDITVFNHPFDVSEDEDGNRYLGAEVNNIALVRGFLAAAKQKLSQGGQIILISSKMRLQRWKLDEAARQLGLEQRVMSFLAENFPGYRHEKTLSRGSARSVTRSLQFAVIFTIRAGVST